MATRNPLLRNANLSREATVKGGFLAALQGESLEGLTLKVATEATSPTSLEGFTLHDVEYWAQEMRLEAGYAKDRATKAVAFIGRMNRMAQGRHLSPDKREKRDAAAKDSRHFGDRSRAFGRVAAVLEAEIAQRKELAAEHPIMVAQRSEERKQLAEHVQALRQVRMMSKTPKTRYKKVFKGEQVGNPFAALKAAM